MEDYEASLHRGQPQGAIVGEILWLPDWHPARDRAITVPLDRLLEEAGQNLAEFERLKNVEPQPVEPRPPLAPWRFRVAAIVGAATAGFLVWAGVAVLTGSHAVFVTAGGGVALAACGAVVWQPLLEARSGLMWTAALANLVACLCESGLLVVVVPGTVLLASCFPSETE